MFAVPPSGGPAGMTEKKDKSLGNISPAMNCRAIFRSPSGTENGRLLLF
jgi:hypothetical protein